MNAPDDAPWKEKATSLPPYPKADDLLPIESSDFDGRYEYLIDTASLLVEKDGITRYSVVIRKPGGTRQHVIHEGLRCEKHIMRIYGMSSGGAMRVQESDWQGIPVDGPYVYRRALHDVFLCSQDGGQLRVEDIIARLKGNETAGLLGRHNSYFSGRN